MYIILMLCIYCIYIYIYIYIYIIIYYVGNLIITDNSNLNLIYFIFRDIKICMIYFIIE